MPFCQFQSSPLGVGCFVGLLLTLVTVDSDTRVWGLDECHRFPPSLRWNCSFRSGGSVSSSGSHEGTWRRFWAHRLGLGLGLVMSSGYWMLELNSVAGRDLTLQLEAEPPAEEKTQSKRCMLVL